MKAFGLIGIGEVRAGDDLAGLLLAALAGQGDRLLPGDLLVVSSKIVSKAQGRVVPAADRAALDASEVVAAESVRLVARRRTPVGLARVVQAAAGPVMAAGGVDSSNVEPGTALLLPVDPDRSARELRSRLVGLGAPRVGVVLSDTAGRAWRDGQIDFALGAAGVRIVDDLRGATDGYGQQLEVTVRALVDEVAALADLLKGKLTGIPAAVVRGLPELVTDDDGPGARALLRTARQDWFRLGHVEAVRTALGVHPEKHEPPTVPMDSVAARLSRVIAVGLAAPTPWGDGPTSAKVEQDGDRALITLDARDQTALALQAALGALAQRLSATAWSEDLVLSVRLEPGRLSVEAADADASRLGNGSAISD